MHVWRPVRSSGGFIGCLLALLLWIEAAACVLYLLSLPGSVTAATFWLALGGLLLLSLGLVVLYWSAAFFTLRYSFDRNQITLRWGGTHQVIPMNQVTQIRRWREGERVRQWGLRWPGYYRGQGRSEHLGQVHFYATAGRDRQILVVTSDEAFVLSPRRPEQFIEEIGIRRGLGVTRHLDQERHYWWIFGWPFWRDRPLWILAGLALLVNFSLVGFLSYRYADLPPLLPIHFVEIVEEGQSRIIADIIGRSQDLFKVPLFGLLILLGNLFLGTFLYRSRPLLVRLLTIVALVVQVIFGLGVLYILIH